MARGRCHSLDSPLEAMLGLASHSLEVVGAEARRDVEVHRGRVQLEEVTVG
jgi:hypothetical protein